MLAPSVLIPTVSIAFADGARQASLTPVTNNQNETVAGFHLSQGARLVEVTRGLYGHSAVRLLTDTTQDHSRETLAIVGRGEIVSPRENVYVYRLDPKPSLRAEEKFGRPDQPVVMMAPVEAEGFCAMAGGKFRLPTKDEAQYILSNGGKSLYPCGDTLFDDKGNRLLAAQLKMKGGKVVRAEEGDPEYNQAPFDVEAKDGKGNLIYPNDLIGTRWGGNVCLWAAGDVLFGGSCFDDDAGVFEDSFFFRFGSVNRSDSVGFGVVSAQ